MNPDPQYEGKQNYFLDTARIYRWNKYSRIWISERECLGLNQSSPMPFWTDSLMSLNISVFICILGIIIALCHRVIIGIKCDKLRKGSLGASLKHYYLFLKIYIQVKKGKHFRVKVVHLSFKIQNFDSLNGLHLLFLFSSCVQKQKIALPISSGQLFSKTVDKYGNTAFKPMSLMISTIMRLLVVPFSLWGFRCMGHFFSATYTISKIP